MYLSILWFLCHFKATYYLGLIAAGLSMILVIRLLFLNICIKMMLPAGVELPNAMVTKPTRLPRLFMLFTQMIWNTNSCWAPTFKNFLRAESIRQKSFSILPFYSFDFARRSFWFAHISKTIFVSAKDSRTTISFCHRPFCNRLDYKQLLIFLSQILKIVHDYKVNSKKF